MGIIITMPGNLSSIRCRLYPTVEQERRLLDTLDICRNLYNHFIFEPRLGYGEGMNLSVLKSLKVGRKGQLRFKAKDRFKSFTYNQSGFSLLHNTLKLSKIGKIKIVLHRTLTGIVKEVHIKRESSGKWFAIIVTATRIANNTTNKIDKPIGLDMGIENFVYDSDGHVVEHPSILKKAARKLGKAQRIFSRRIKGSNNRNKQRFKVARLHEKIGNQGKDFLHKLSSRYVSKYNHIC